MMSTRTGARRRRGKVLAMFVLLIPVLLGMVGLVIDTGLLMGSQRLSQNSADAAALAGAQLLSRGQTLGQAQAAATAFIQTHNGLSGTTVTSGHPTSGPHASNTRYFEVGVTRSTQTFFVRALGLGTASNVRGRAVAGYEATAGVAEGAIALNPTALPGIDLRGGSNLTVDGGVIVNSDAAGYDFWGTWFDLWNPCPYAVDIGNNNTFRVRTLHVHGGVNDPAKIEKFTPSDPLQNFYAGEPLFPDPLRDVPVPTSANGANLTLKGAVKVQSNTPKPTILQPGVYDDIEILNGTDVRFQPGIYVLRPTKNNQGLRINGGAGIQGTGVMFYFSGSNYMKKLSGGGNSTVGGEWDNLDDAQARLDGPLPPTNAASVPPAPSSENINSVKFSTLTLNPTNATINLRGITDTNSPFKDILFFFRRRNDTEIRIQGNAGPDVFLGGTIYNKWANFNIAGGGRYDARFVVGSLNLSGQSDVNIVPLPGSTQTQLGRQVFLTE